jgi:release factor glutamine methyltransferase
VSTLTWRRLWDETTEAVGDRTVARWLCEEASGFDGPELSAGLDELATQRMVAHLDAMVARVRAGEPVQYALGHWAFRTLDVMVDRRVLIPRPETELVAEVAIGLARECDRPIVVADLGTGSGAIGLALAAELPREGVVIWLTDRSADALDVARANLSGLGRAGANVRVSQGSWYDALPAELEGRLAVVVSNPPYVAEGDPELEAIVARHEPAAALLAGPDGLAALREVIVAAPRWLRPGGWLVLEIGHRQGAAVADLLTGAGLVDVEVRPDLAGRDRIALARRRPGR